jgi:hypothetical protein
MDYPFENLGPEKFQQFAQALLTKEFPNLQCFPVGQPDGGRDAVQWPLFERKGGFVIFQVKFARLPQSISEPHKWLLTIIDEEVPKVKRLIPQGAKEYVFFTNVAGTGHLSAGSIDIANEKLTKILGINSVCWWRDDLSRRLDNAWDLKWAYPELMTGPDLIRYIIESGLSESKERRASALRAFTKHQYSMEQEVKFKQVELQNKLLDLFVDVPIEPTGIRGNQDIIRRQYEDDQSFIHVDDEEEEEDTFSGPDRQNYIRRWHHLRSATWLNNESISTEDFDHYRTHYLRARGISGAGDFLLRRDFQGVWPRVVLEGAPGHGKSTIIQYVCQVHRMRLLEMQDEVRLLPEFHKTAPLRLPIKVDLRDLESWLARRNPFTPEGGEIASNEWLKSLEGFLCALIRYQSGGLQFEVADLHAVAKLSAILLVLDGLDEVADIARRQEVVDEIVKGIDRLEANAASLQVVVTSRPAAFANSPGLPQDKFKYLELGDLSRELIDEYAQKWLKARRLQERESADVKKILREKLNQPHLRDLARNPMQLAILLSLIHTRGTSLPDKRTALYDSYIELFFNREAEKSSVVRDHRELLINIHRYLAWLLHSEVELGAEQEPGRRNGTIAAERLIEVLKKYLENEGHNPMLAQNLFTGMVERVVALVSRVQGTYEFEVQPLREYFAARFLYETAPYSPPGAEKRGTKPDRFDAIARNFYWLNVTRFYAGCYSKGELASLIDRLQELSKDPDYGLTSHPRILGAILLSDWVFSQHPKSVNEVVNLILDGVGLRFVLASSSRRVGSSSPLVLPKGCGKQELFNRCISLLRSRPALDYALDVIDLLKANVSSAETFPAWLDGTLATNFAARTSWLEYGLQLGCLSAAPLDRLREILSDEPSGRDRIDILFRAKRFDFLQSSDSLFTTAVNSILSVNVEPVSTSRPQALIDVFCRCIDANNYAAAFRSPVSAPLSAVLKHADPQAGQELRRVEEKVLPFSDAAACSAFCHVAQAQLARPAAQWSSELSPWDSIIEEGRRLWGDRWAFYHTANVASGIKSSTETCTDCSDLFDYTKSLCRRTRYARLRAGTASWWPKHFQAAQTVMERLQVSQVWLTWASENSILQSLEPFNYLVAGLETDDWSRLYDSVQRSIVLTKRRAGDRLINISLASLPGTISPRTCVALGARSSLNTRRDLYRTYLASYKGDDLRVLRF